MNFRQKYFALLLCHSTFEMFSITVHVIIIFFSQNNGRTCWPTNCLSFFQITVTPSNTEIHNEHTVNHIFQYPNGEALHPVIKNFEDFQKIQNHVGSGLKASQNKKGQKYLGYLTK